MTAADQHNAFTIDVEDWYHVLDTPAAPPISQWDGLDSRLAASLERMLAVLARTGARATMFWLGWLARRHPDLVRRCQQAGHEIASHGYGHVLAYQVGRRAFHDDIARARAVLEDITGQAVHGFRAPGFGITEKALWAFEVIREAGYSYDASVFPASRGHGGISGSPMGPYLIQTKAGALPEFPMSVVEVLGRRMCLFCGGYLRLSPRWLIRWGIRKLQAAGRPLVVLIHPREVDPDHPRLPMTLSRRFKSYVNLKTTMPKMEWLCRQYRFSTMRELSQSLVGQADLAGVQFA